MGIDIKRISVAQNESKRLNRILKVHKIDSLFDIGANTGQFGSELRANSYQGKIISFEPLLEAHKKLTEAASKDNNWFVHKRGAIGSESGEIEINVAGNLASSSILEMNDLHVQAAPYTNKIGTEKVPIWRLDDVASDYLDEDSKYFIKIDTQGYEYQVMQGAEKMLFQCKVLQTELSLVELYSGQVLFEDMLKYIKGLGFELWGLEPAFVDSSTGRTLQVDAIFVKP